MADVVVCRGGTLNYSGDVVHAVARCGAGWGRPGRLAGCGRTAAGPRPAAGYPLGVTPEFDGLRAGANPDLDGPHSRAHPEFDGLRARAHPELDAWRSLPAAQQPDWPDPQALRQVARTLSRLHPLVVAAEVDQLRGRLAAVATGQALLLQGGDCAETFEGATERALRGTLKTLLQMAVVLTYGAGLPVVKLARIAGQYAKPRSAQLDASGLPSYRGDMINDLAATAAARRPDPARLLRAYHTAASTLNLLRALATGGEADLRRVHDWNKDFVRTSPPGDRYEGRARESERAVALLRASGLPARALPARELCARP